MSSREAAELAYQALGAAVDGQPMEASRLLTRVLQDSDVDRVFALCRVFAEGGRRALLKAFGDKAPDLANGDHWGIEQLRAGTDDPAVLFSLRFLVAHCNGDEDMCRAHYDVMLAAGGDVRLHGVARLFGDVAKLIREATEPVTGEDGR